MMLIGSNEDDMKFIIEKLSFKMLTSYRLRIFIHYHDRTHITGLPSDWRTLTKDLLTVTAQIPATRHPVHGLKFSTMSTDKRLH